MSSNTFMRPPLTKPFDPASPLVLARVWTATVEKQFDYDVRKAGLVMEDQGYFDGEFYRDDDTIKCYRLTDKGRAAIAGIDKFDIVSDEVKQEAQNDPSVASNVALWFALLTYGHQESVYYNFFPFGANSSVPHILTCGVDANMTSAPYDHDWSTFTDTESPNDQHTGIGATFTCQCGLIKGLEMVMPQKGYAWLINFMANPVQEFLDSEPRY